MGNLLLRDLRPYVTIFYICALLLLLINNRNYLLLRDIAPNVTGLIKTVVIMMFRAAYYAEI